MSGIAVALTGVIAFGVLMIVVALIRRNRLKERYAIIWMTLAVGIVLLVVARPLLDRLSDALGIQSGVSTLFLLSTLVILGVLLQLSVSLTTLQEQVRDLAEAIALHEARSHPIEHRDDRGD